MLYMNNKYFNSKIYFLKNKINDSIVCVGSWILPLKTSNKIYFGEIWISLNSLYLCDIYIFRHFLTYKLTNIFKI